MGAYYLSRSIFGSAKVLDKRGQLTHPNTFYYIAINDLKICEDMSTHNKIIGDIPHFNMFCTTKFLILHNSMMSRPL